MIRCLAYAFTAIFKSKARLVAENLCLRQQLIVLKRRQAKPQLRDADRRFWVLACELFGGWHRSLIVVRPDTVVSWHRKGWKAYWRWRSRRPFGTGRRKIDPELRELIGRMARENPLWGAQNSGRVGTSWLWSLCTYCCQIHATFIQRNALPRLASIPDPA